MSVELFPFLGYAAASDLRTRKISNALVVIGLVAAFTFSLFVSWEQLWMSAAGALVGGVMLMPFFGWKMMGGGDVKLAALIGAITGFPYVLVAIPLGLAAGAVVISGLQFTKIVKPGDKVPLAPMLVMGAVGAFVCAEALLDAYARIFISG